MIALFILAIILSSVFLYRYQKISIIARGYDEKSIALKKILLLIFIGLFPILLAGLRSVKVGIDTSSIYYPYYYVKYCVSNISYDGSEFGFYCILKIGYYIFHSYNGVLFFIALLTFYLSIFGILYFKNRINVALASFLFLLFSFFDSLNIMRQMLAVALTIFSLRFLDRKFYFRYIFFILLAATIHNSAIIMVILIPSKMFENKKIRLIAFTIILCCLIFLLPLIIELMGKMSFFEKYYRLYKINFEFSLTNFALVIYNLPAFIIILFFRKRLIKYDRRNILFLIMALLSFEAALFKLYMVWISRLISYFTVGIYILLAQCGKLCKTKRGGQLLNACLICYGLFYFVLFYYILGNAGIFPYQFLGGN